MKSFAFGAFAVAALGVVVPMAMGGSAAVAQTQAAAPAGQTVVVREGTEMRIAFQDRLSSATNRQGDVFTIMLLDPVTLAGGVVLPAGYRGRGEVTAAEKRGFMGRAGELSVRLDSLRVGDARIRLRSSKTSEGQGAMGSTIALTVLFGPLGLLKRGHDIEIPRGQAITAFVDGDATLTLPLSPPPLD